jgi:antitoxin ParD1/3/4
MALNVSLPPELEARVRQRVESGMYGSASEVIREALRVFELYEKAREAKIEALRTDIAKGLADIEAGRVARLDIEAVRRRGREALKRRKATK